MLQGIWKSVPVVLMICVAGLFFCSSLPAEEHGTAESATHAAHAAGEHGSDAGHDAGHGDDHHGPYSIKSDLPLWSAVAFIGFVIAIKVLGLWDLLLNSMSDREKAESDAITLAEGDLSQTQELLRRSRGRIEALDEQIRETMAEAHRDAQSTRDEIFTAAEQEAKAAVERATHEINRVKDQSLNDIFETLANKVADVTERRLRDGLQPDDHDRLVDSVLGDLVLR